MFLKGLCWSITTITRKDTWIFFMAAILFWNGHGFLLLSDPWIGSKKESYMTLLQQSSVQLLVPAIASL